MQPSFSMLLRWKLDSKLSGKLTIVDVQSILHNLTEIFSGLKEARREKHRQWYGIIASQAGSSVTLGAALEANANMVRDFKYGDYDGDTASVVGGEVVGDVVVGGDGALISYGQFVIDDLELTILEHTKIADKFPPP